ncbi:MAG: DUF697 domain-containing protein [Lachnospiraceae bacterium]|nr:DUF697 domain-containing protein [Lachnospiraceae bacterium]
MVSNDDLSKMRSDAQKTVMGFVATATASCAVPIPVADAAILIGEQITMMTAVSSIYKLGLSKKTLQRLIIGVLGASGASVVGKTIVSSAFKLIPGLGSVAGTAISAGTAGTLTFALGNAFIELCESVKKGELKESDLEGKKGIEHLKNLIKETKTNDEELGKNEYKRIEEQGNKIEPLYKESNDAKTEKESMPKDKQKESTLEEISFSGLSSLKDLEARGGRSISIEYKGSTIGYMEFTRKSGGALILQDMNIIESYRGKGIATYSVEHVLAFYQFEVSEDVREELKNLD